MKCAIILAEGGKQIMFTPENDSERMALKFITPDDDISLDVKHGQFFGSPPDSARGYVVKRCQGGYLRAFDDEQSLMLVLRPKEKPVQLPDAAPVG